MAGASVKDRFAELRLPKAAPRLWLWAVIGGAYYVLFFFLLRSVLAQPPLSFWNVLSLILIAGLLIANAIWNWVFFRKKDVWLSFALFLPYLALAVTLAFVLLHMRSPLFGWFALYLAYLAYATWWGYRVWKLNRGSFSATTAPETE